MRSAGDVAAVDARRRRPSRGGWIWRGRGSPGSWSSSAAPGGAEELGGELQHAAGVGDDLDGLDAGDLVEEPAATGVHELGVAFQLEQFKQGDALFGREDARGVACEEAVDGGRRAVEDDVDVGVARAPEVDAAAARRALRPAARWRRAGSRAPRAGARATAGCQPGLPPLQPQLERQRSTPCTQLQEVFSTTSASHSGGNFSRNSP